MSEVRSLHENYTFQPKSILKIKTANINMRKVASCTSPLKQYEEWFKHTCIHIFLLNLSFSKSRRFQTLQNIRMSSTSPTSNLKSHVNTIILNKILLFL